MQNDQGLPRGRAVREEVTPSVGPHAPFHVRPVFNGMHSLSPDENVMKGQDKSTDHKLKSRGADSYSFYSLKSKQSFKYSFSGLCGKFKDHLSAKQR